MFDLEVSTNIKKIIWFDGTNIQPGPRKAMQTQEPLVIYVC